MRSVSFTGAVAFGLIVVALAKPASAEGIPAKYKPTVKRGLEWLAKNQFRDGHWEGSNGNYPVAMTGLSGMCFLMEGSTVREGKYADNIRRARDWLMARVQPNGMIGNPKDNKEGGRYMYGHGFGLLFLACAYGEEKDVEKRKRLEDILTRACKFTYDAQTSRGGWGYLASTDPANTQKDWDEGSVTITQVQALRAARNAGIKVPKEAIDKTLEYLKKSTNSQGGIIYSLYNDPTAHGEGRGALTAAAIACCFNAGDYKSPLVRKWFKFCESAIHDLQPGRWGHDEYTHYYYAQALYCLGDKSYNKLMSDSKEGNRLNWIAYRNKICDFLKDRQVVEGAGKTIGYWPAPQSFNGGTVQVTAMHLAIMLLDNNTLPIYQR